MRTHVTENWKTLPHKIKDLNMNPVRGSKLKISLFPSENVIPL